MSSPSQDRVHVQPYHSDPARIQELRHLLLNSIEKSTPCDAILLSGGVDTSILAEAAFSVYNNRNKDQEDPQNPAKPPLTGAITVLCTDQATDEFYAHEISKRTGLVQEVVKISLDSVLEELEFCIKTLETFDPMELRNGIVIARGLSIAKSLGYKSVMTGDGADELFAGYSFLHNMSPERLQAYSDKLTKTMRFSGVTLAKALGLELRQPYLDPELIRFSQQCTKDEKINTHEHTKEREWQDRLSGSQLHGKFILREAFQEEAFSAWRKKEPIEVGSGTTVLPQLFQESMSPEDLKAEQDRIMKEEGIEIRDVEHLQYFKVFKKVFGSDLSTYPEKLVKDGRDPCPGCGFNLRTPDQTFCVICGKWPARILPPPEEIAKAEAEKSKAAEVKATTEQ
ncbi:asparagine synthase (glutamine-hydrolysing) [Entomortierella parvispora]|uniref:Asparagine synthase (Glutamine-hydrolysing) n=1 Tax=Entomortierella parvispora TaxID=205924 RepID=A0A9P3HA91_9FUNG|nr:asparagine synthase (glutamine-hydrolysing) [Entomortierella parvispora]